MVEERLGFGHAVHLPARYNARYFAQGRVFYLSDHIQSRHLRVREEFTEGVHLSAATAKVMKQVQEILGPPYYLKRQWKYQLV